MSEAALGAASGAAFGIPGAIIGGGIGLLGGMAQSSAARKAAKREREFFEKQLAARRADPILATLTGQFEQATADIGRLPALLRQRRQAALTSQGQLQRQRIRQSMARAGVTGASEVGIRAERGLLGGLEQQRQAGELGEAQLLGGLRGQLAGMGANILAQKHALPGQLVGGLGQSIGQYTQDPLLQGLQGALTGGIIGGQFGGRRTTPAIGEEVI